MSGLGIPVLNMCKPRGGLQFIGGPYAHCYTIGESRLWFPCVDSNTELSTWTLEFTVDARLTGSVRRRLLHTNTKSRKNGNFRV